MHTFKLTTDTLTRHDLDLGPIAKTKNTADIIAKLANHCDFYHNDGFLALLERSRVDGDMLDLLGGNDHKCAAEDVAWLKNELEVLVSTYLPGQVGIGVNPRNEEEYGFFVY